MQMKVGSWKSRQRSTCEADQHWKFHFDIMSVRRTHNLVWRTWCDFTFSKHHFHPKKMLSRIFHCFIIGFYSKWRINPKWSVIKSEKEGASVKPVIIKRMHSISSWKNWSRFELDNVSAGLSNDFASVNSHLSRFFHDASHFFFFDWLKQKG